MRPLKLPGTILNQVTGDSLRVSQAAGEQLTSRGWLAKRGPEESVRLAGLRSALARPNYALAVCGLRLLVRDLADQTGSRLRGHPPRSRFELLRECHQMLIPTVRYRSPESTDRSRADYISSSSRRTLGDVAQWRCIIDAALARSCISGGTAGLF